MLRQRQRCAEEEIAEEDCVYEDIEVEQVPVNGHLISCFTRNSNTQPPEVISVGSTIEDATEDHESPMDERGARRADRFMLCPSVLVPNNSHTNQMFSSGSKTSQSGTKTDSINKISNNEQQKAGGGNQYFRSS